GPDARRGVLVDPGGAALRARGGLDRAVAGFDRDFAARSGGDRVVVLGPGAEAARGVVGCAAADEPGGALQGAEAVGRERGGGAGRGAALEPGAGARAAAR